MARGSLRPVPSPSALNAMCRNRSYGPWGNESWRLVVGSPPTLLLDWGDVELIVYGSTDLFRQAFIRANEDVPLSPKHLPHPGASATASRPIRSRPSTADGEQESAAITLQFGSIHSGDNRTPPASAIASGLS